MPQPKTTPQTLCEPAQSKRMSRFHKRHFIQKFTGKMLQPKFTLQTLCEFAQSKRMSKCHKSHFIWKFTGKMPQTKTAPQTLWEPAPSKRMSRFHKSHCTRKFTRKIPQTKMSPERGHTFCASRRSRNACQNFTRTFMQKLTGKMPQSRVSTLIKHRPLHFP